MNPKYETRLHLVHSSWFNFHAIFNVPRSFTNYSRYRKYNLGISVFCLCHSLWVFFELQKHLNQFVLTFCFYEELSQVHIRRYYFSKLKTYIPVYFEAVNGMSAQALFFCLLILIFLLLRGKLYPFTSDASPMLSPNARYFYRLEPLFLLPESLFLRN